MPRDRAIDTASVVSLSFDKIAWRAGRPREHDHPRRLVTPRAGWQTVSRARNAASFGEPSMHAVPVVIVLLVAGVLPQGKPQAVDISSLAWLAGCWTGGSDARQVEEHWMKPAGGTMFGMSRTVGNGKTVESEFIELRQQGKGVAYIAHPANQASASFPWVSGTDTSARFENPAHDFPQTISYTLNPDGSLLARVEGVMKGKRRAIDFPMRRGGC
jgi:hypothetical protein